jgi:hypothetical protein
MSKIKITLPLEGLCGGRLRDVGVFRYKFENPEAYQARPDIQNHENKCAQACKADVVKAVDGLMHDLTIAMRQSGELPDGLHAGVINHAFIHNNHDYTRRVITVAVRVTLAREASKLLDDRVAAASGAAGCLTLPCGEATMDLELY